MIDLPVELTRKVAYPACLYDTNIQLAECIQTTRGAIDMLNRNMAAVAEITTAAMKTANRQ